MCGRSTSPPARAHLATQADLDLGNYERFIDLTLTKDNNLTTGKIYSVRAARWGRPTRV